ncbi:hypothetical protein M0804_005410 [Polistes exclamans]|nr:hypothetical protein M0804_005410 [Polistes exclamans]
MNPGSHKNNKRSDQTIQMFRGIWIRWPLLSTFLLGSNILLVVAQCGSSIQDRQERQDRQDKLALYKITLRTYWSRARFPRHYPEWKPPAQFGKLIVPTGTSMGLNGIPYPGSKFNIFSTSFGSLTSVKLNTISNKSHTHVKINSIYTKLKDRVDKLEQSNLVYKIPCVCDKCYIGQTKQKLKKRLDQHKNDCKPMNAQKSNITALAEHHFSTGHNFKFDETNILDKEDNCTIRKSKPTTPPTPPPPPPQYLSALSYEVSQEAFVLRMRAC